MVDHLSTGFWLVRTKDYIRGQYRIDPTRSTTRLAKGSPITTRVFDLSIVYRAGRLT